MGCSIKHGGDQDYLLSHETVRGSESCGAASSEIMADQTPILEGRRLCSRVPLLEATTSSVRKVLIQQLQASECAITRVLIQ